MLTFTATFTAGAWGSSRPQQGIWGKVPPVYVWVF